PKNWRRRHQSSIGKIGEDTATTAATTRSPIISVVCCRTPTNIHRDRPCVAVVWCGIFCIGAIPGFFICTTRAPRYLSSTPPHHVLFLQPISGCTVTTDQKWPSSKQVSSCEYP